MKDEMHELTQLNKEVGKAENRDGRDWFQQKLATTFAFQRKDRKTFEDRVSFLGKEIKGTDRVTEIESIQLHGNRAIVTCVVLMGNDRFHNIRLWVREDENSEWKLLGWANEQV